MKCCCGLRGNSAWISGVAVVLAGSVATVFAQPAKDTPAKADKPAPAVQPAKADATVNTLTEAEKKAGWVLLFDGKSLEHFKGFKSDAVPATWEVVDGTMHAKGGGGDIETKDEYKDFEFSCEWKISEGGNSGIIYRCVDEGGATYETGPEFQILDNKNAKFKDANPLNKAGAMYDFYPASKDMAKPAGEWNTAKVIVKGTKVEHWWNGEKVIDGDMGTEAFKKQVAASKFNVWKGFGIQPKGHIAFQDHGDQVWFRNVKIRVIK